MTRLLKKLSTTVLIVSAFCAGALAQTPPAGSPVARHGALRVEGNRVVDQHGHPVVLRGMSYFWSNPGWEGGKFYNAGTVNTFVDDWKVNVVRVAVNPRPEERGGYRTVIDRAIQRGIYVVVDWHSHQAHREQAAAQAFFRAVHQTYGNIPNIIYEIYNEPCPPRPNDPNFASCAGDNWVSDIRPYSQAMVNFFRNELRTNNIIVIGTPDFSKRVDTATDPAIQNGGPVTGTNLVYAIHFYTAEAGTDHRSALRQLTSVALNRGHAVMATEWGLSEADGGQRNPTRIDTTEANLWFDFMDRNFISWMNWSVCDKNEAASALRPGAPANGGWNASHLSSGGTFIRNKLRFYDQRHTLTVTTTGQGTVTRDHTISDGYTPGTPVTLTAVPTNGWSFAGFEVGDGIIENPYVLTMGTANRTINAVFNNNANLINNGHFTVSALSWNIFEGTITPNNHELRVAPSSSAALHESYVRQGNISLEAGREYTLSFRARGQSNRTIVPRVTNSNRSVDFILDTSPASLTTTMPTQPFTRRFVAPQTLTNAVVSFSCGGNQTVWFLDDVSLMPGDMSSVAPGAAAVRNVPWSVVRAGGSVQLRGPADAGAQAMLYDTRGRMVRTMQARDGLAISDVGISAGNYLLIVRNGSGSEVLRTRVSLVR